MGPNNGENQSGGVATLEPPQTPTVVTPEGGNGLLPTPGASAPEIGAMPAVSEATPATTEAATPTTMPDLGAPITASTETPATLNSMAPLGTPDVATLQATHSTMVAEKAAAQAAPPRPGLGNRLLGFIGLRGGVKTEVVGQPTNAMPDHLKDGVTPPVPNVTPEAAAAVNQEPVMPSVPDSAPAVDPLAATVTEIPSSTLEEVGAATATPEAPSLTSEPAVPDADVAPVGAEVADPVAASAVTEAESIVKNAADTNAALDEIDKTATTALDATSSDAKPEDTAPTGTVDSSSGAFPSYGVRTEADASPSATDGTPSSAGDVTPSATPSTEAPSAWPASPSTEPTTSGPSAVVEPVVAAPTVPEYKPTTDMTSAGEAAAPTTPASWSIDASAAHPDAPVVDSLPSAPEAPSALPSSDPNALALETNPTPLAGTPASTEAPFGTGMPPSLGGSATESTTGITATPEDQPDTMTPTAPATERDAMATAPLSSDASTSAPEAVQGVGTPPPPAIESPSGNVDASGLSTGVAEVPGSGAMGQPLQETLSTPEPAAASTSSFPSAAETPIAPSPTAETAVPVDPLTASPTTTTS